MKASTWQTKSSDRFVLRGIKVHLSAKFTPKLVGYEKLKPWMITLFSRSVGVMASILVTSQYVRLMNTRSGFQPDSRSAKASG